MSDWISWYFVLKSEGQNKEWCIRTYSDVYIKYDYSNALIILTGRSLAQECYSKSSVYGVEGIGDVWYSIFRHCWILLSILTMLSLLFVYTTRWLWVSWEYTLYQWWYVDFIQLVNDWNSIRLQQIIALALSYIYRRVMCLLSSVKV